MPAYTLPDLDYDFSALEPHVSSRVLLVHYGRHHKAYVERSNEALEKIEEARQARNFWRIPTLEKSLAFNVSGHVLHSIFWKNLRPKGGGEPTGRLAEWIARDFGSFAGFRVQLTEVAATIMGSGWAALVYEPLSRRLLTCQIYDHQSNLIPGGVALMVIDAWEHAYYLQYRDRKGEYLKAVWNLWNWDDVGARLAAAQWLTLPAAEPRATPLSDAAAGDREKARGGVAFSRAGAGPTPVQPERPRSFGNRVGSAAAGPERQTQPPASGQSSTPPADPEATWPIRRVAGRAR